MGAFYGSIHVRTENSEIVQRALAEVVTEAGCKFLLGPPLKGWISVFPENSGQSDQVSAGIAKHFAGEILHLLVHDDDIFCYYFYRDGRLVDRYNSSPDYFEEASAEEKRQCQGRPGSFQNLLPKQASLDKLKTLLAADKKAFPFEGERMGQFVKLLGLPNALSSYEYLQSGERDEIKRWKQFIHVPDLNAEKTAKRALQAKIKAEKKRLQKEGILLAEIKAPKRKGPGLPLSISWEIDSASDGLILGWLFYPFIDDAQSLGGLFAIQPPWDSPLPPLGLTNNWSAYVIGISPTAKWLAGGFGSGDWKMRVWDWQRKEFAFAVSFTRSVSWIKFSQDEQLVYSLGGDEFIAIAMADKYPVITIRGLAGARTAAIHPSRKYAAVIFQTELGILDLEQKKLVKRLHSGTRTQKIDLFEKGPPGTVLISCLEGLLETPELRNKLGIGPELHAAILQDPKAIELLAPEAQQKLKSLIEKVRYFEYGRTENLFDACFNPDGSQLFLAGDGMKVIDWQKILMAINFVPAPELFVEAPKDDEKDPNSHPLAYGVRFDADRGLLLSCCYAGVVQYLNINTGQSGILLKTPEEITIMRMELTRDKKALVCNCADRPLENHRKGQRLQIWNYPALCKAAGLE